MLCINTFDAYNAQNISVYVSYYTLFVVVTLIKLSSFVALINKTHMYFDIDEKECESEGQAYVYTMVSFKWMVISLKNAFELCPFQKLKSFKIKI